MAQIAADELDVAMARIVLRSGDTELTPNEGYTAGSQSIQFGGVAMRQACADVRALFLDQAAKIIGCAPDELSIRDGSILRKGAADRPGLLDARRRGEPGRQGDRQRAAQAGRGHEAYRRQQRAPRPAGQDFRQRHIHPRHAARRHGACARGAPAQSRRHHRRGRRERRSCAPPRRRSNSCAMATSSPSSATTRPPSIWRLPPRSITSRWQNVEAPTATQQEANWLLQRPAVDRVFGAPDEGNPQGKQRFEATYTRGYLAHASISPSCGLAEYRDGHLTVWTHCQGVYPLRAALVEDARARSLRHHRAPRAGLRLLRP